MPDRDYWMNAEQIAYYMLHTLIDDKPNVSQEELDAMGCPGSRWPVHTVPWRSKYIAQPAPRLTPQEVNGIFALYHRKYVAHT